MSSNNESQCYFVQLQFDSFLDGELTGNQQESFLQHVNSCAECAHEFRYAQTIQDELVDLPLLDCSEEALAPLHDLAQGAAPKNTDSASTSVSWLSDLAQWLGAAPMGLRFAFPVLLLAAIGLITLPQLLQPEQGTGGAPAIAANQPTASMTSPATTAVQYSPEDVAQALRDLTTALEYLNQAGQRTESMVGGRFLINPLQNRLNASFDRVRDNVRSEIAGEEI